MFVWCVCVCKCVWRCVCVTCVGVFDIEVCILFCVLFIVSFVGLATSLEKETVCEFSGVPMRFLRNICQRHTKVQYTIYYKVYSVLP